MCQSCYNLQQREKNQSITIDELKHKHKNREIPNWYSAEIRNYAKMWNADLVSLPCQMCGYAHHTELCHIKPINKFLGNTTLGEVNDPSNIVVLCPNHHWELDNGVLSIEEIPKRKMAEATGAAPSDAFTRR